MTQNMGIYIPPGQDHLWGPVRKIWEVILKITTEAKLQTMNNFYPICFNTHKNICNFCFAMVWIWSIIRWGNITWWNSHDGDCLDIDLVLRFPKSDTTPQNAVFLYFDCVHFPNVIRIGLFPPAENSVYICNTYFSVNVGGLCVCACEAAQLKYAWW